MAINTLATLKTTVAAYLKRNDLSSMLDTFVELATARFNESDVRVPQMEALVTTTVTSEWTALPDDFLGMRYMENSDGERLSYVNPEQFSLYVQRDVRPDPGVYTIADMSFRIWPTPTSETVELLYWQRVPGLTNPSDTNWLLQGFPQAYLAATLAAAYDYLQDDVQAAKWDAKATAAMAAIKRAGSRIATGAASITIRTA